MRILIFDNNQQTSTQLKNEFKRGDDIIYETQDCEQALKHYQDDKPDMVLLGAELEEDQGFELCAKIRGLSASSINFNDQKTPIIFITVEDSYEDRKKGFAVGASDFISRSFLASELKKLTGQIFASDNQKRFVGLKVLIAEDNDATQSLLERILQTEGIECVQAENGSDALAILKEDEGTIDLLLTDYLMPKMDGLELCQKVRNELHSKIPIIFLSGISEMDSVVKIFKSGASDYIPKPFTKEELLARFNVHLQARKLSQTLEDQIEELERLNQVKNRLLSITSHDLRSPLNSILGFTELFTTQSNLTTEQQEWLGMMKRSGNFLLDLIGDLLTLGKIYGEPKINLEPLDLTLILSTVMEVSLPTASLKQISLKFDPEDQMVRTYSDHNALMRIFGNLMSNAIKFTEPGGKIEVQLETKPDVVQVLFKDNGIGIPSQALPKLFEDFGSYSRVGTADEPSTGLGLSIVHELVSKLGGRIEASSDLDEGSCFTVTLPRVDSLN